MAQDQTVYTDTEPSESPAISDMVAPKEPKPANVGYRILAAVFFLLGVGGLFLGLLGQKVEFFATRRFVSNGAMSGSLAGYFIDFVKFHLIDGAFSAAFQSGASSALSVLVELLLLVLLAVAVVTSVVLFIISMVSGGFAKKAAPSMGKLVLLSYGSLFLWSYTFLSYTSGASSLTSSVCDIPTALIAGVALILLIAMSIVRRKGRGLLDVLLLAVPFVIALLLSYPGSYTVAMTHAAPLEFGSFTFLRIALLFLNAVLAFNILVSVARADAKKAYVFDCVRFALLLLGELLTVIAFIVYPELTGSRTAIFQGEQLIYTIAFLVLGVAAFVLSIIGAVVFKDRREETDLGGEWEETSPIISSPATYDVLPEREQPHEEPMSEFERRMEALARGEQPDGPANAAEEPVKAPPMQRTIVHAPSYFDSATQYTYDPFINGLTPQEKNEFGDLFIAGKAGKIDCLPTYVIGGDNTEFFRKVFIYLGKFRKDISSELLDKLYSYVSKNG